MRATKHIMGMPITVDIDSPDEGMLDRVFEYFQHVDSVFSTYKPDSEISKINNGHLNISRSSSEVEEVLQACEAYKLKTLGYFDAQRPDGRIDPSGLVKGWAIANAADLVRGVGVQNYFIEAGGDVQMRGVSAKGKPWQVGIRNPLQPDKFAVLLEISDGAVATSGIYERGQHIYDPHTGRAVDDPISLSVAGPNIYEADILATAALAMGPKGIQFVFDQGLEGMMITKNGRAVFTPGFKLYGKEKRSV